MHPLRRSGPRETAPCGRPFPCGLGERVTAAGERAATSRGSHVLSGGKAERHRKARRKTDFPQTRTPRAQAAPSGCPRLCGKWGPLVTTEAACTVGASAPVGRARDEAASYRAARRRCTRSAGGASARPRRVRDQTLARAIGSDQPALRRLPVNVIPPPPPRLLPRARGGFPVLRLLPPRGADRGPPP